MNPSVMVEPFRHETRTLNLADMQPVHFYVPAVLALLLQHIAVSLAGLSIVSERLAGTTEIMRAGVVAGSPLSTIFCQPPPAIPVATSSRMCLANCDRARVRAPRSRCYVCWQHS
jgi:hypothetical protein